MKDPTPLRRTGYAIVIVALFFLAAMPPAAAAQTLYGSVVGNVTDGQGATVPGASVTLINTGTNLRRETVTDAQGAYSFINVLAGPYDVKIALQGFREAVRTGVPVTVGQISRVDMTLEIGAMTETVTVKSEAELLQTDKSDVKTELKTDEIVNLPLNQFRNYQALVVLVPGSLPPTLQNAETDTPQRSLAMTVNGQSGNANTTMTDGTRSVNVAMQHHELYIQPAETIETVTVTTGSMDAEQGMAAGAAITVTTKSGTNNFKGSAFEFFNNQKLNASPFYFGRGAVPAKLPVERQTFGGTLGGPIVKNRLFFFGSYEGYRSKAERYTFYTVPDAALRNGDFSNALNTNGTLQRIYDPMSGDMSTGNGRAQFANNVIPADRFNSISKTLLALYPMPNVEGTGAGNLTNNYRVAQNSSTVRHNVDAKVNWNRTPAHQFWGKYSEMRAVVDDLFTFPIGESDDDGGHTNTYQFTSGQTWSIGPTLLLDSSFGILFNDQFVSSPDFSLGNLGLDQRDASFTTNITKVSGKHDVRAGYAATYMKLDYWQPENANPRGSFVFAQNATRTFGTGSQTANFYNQYAAFLLGLVGTAGKSYQYELFTTREWQHALFVRDRWTPSPKLTLDLGVRWEYYPVMTRADRDIEMLDLNTLDVLIGGLGGNPKNMGLKAPLDAFAPRLGAVYRLNENTVLRSGYGLTFDAQAMGAQVAFAGYQQYPLALNASYLTPAAQSTFGWYGTLNQGIPLLEGPDISSGRVPLPNAIGMQTVAPETMHRGKTHSWNVAFERRLPLVSVDVAYVGNKRVGGLAQINVNPVQTLGGGAADRPYFASHGRQLAVNVYRPYTRSDYNALQVGVTRPLTNGLLLKGHYTYSRSMALGYGYQLPSADAEERNWARANGDRPHTMTMSFVYLLPWQTSTGGRSILKTLINDWQVNGIFQAFSGSPFTVTADGTALNTPGNTQTADLVGTVTKVGGIGAEGVYLDPAAWAQPEGVRFGTSRVNQFRGPGGWNLDFSVFRTFPIAARQKLEFRVEASNMTNTPKFGNPTANITSGDFMRIFSLYNAYAERQVRLAVRYSF
jgi:outer membrane receptor protein involved in Fe transport